MATLDKLIRKIGVWIQCHTMLHKWVEYAPEEPHIEQKLCMRCTKIKTRLP